MAVSLADQLRARGVRGILISAAEQGVITEFKCAIPDCLCPRGPEYFENVTSEQTDWIPTIDHFPKRQGVMGDLL